MAERWERKEEMAKGQKFYLTSRAIRLVSVMQEKETPILAQRIPARLSCHFFLLSFPSTTEWNGQLALKIAFLYASSHEE